MSDDIETRTLKDYEIGDPLSSLAYDNFTYVDIPDTNYHLITSPGGPYIIKNRSGNPVYLVINDSNEGITESDEEILIGGITYEKVTETLKYTWIRSSVPNITVAVRPYNIFDPTENVANLGNNLNDLTAAFNQHITNIANPHQVTKAQVGLGTLPNSKSDSVTSNSSNTLATTKLTRQIQVQLNAHEARKDNPHEVTKAQVGLSEVDNYPTCDYRNLNDCLDTVTEKFVNPATAHRIARMAALPAESIRPQAIIATPLGTLTNDWLLGECDYPATHTVIRDNTHVLVKRGLQVSYTYAHKSMISEPLDVDIAVLVPTETNTYYLYVDVNAEGFITGANVTVVPPTFGYHKLSSGGDFFNLSTYDMFDKNNAAIRRVYISRVYVSAGIATSLINVPLGTKYTVPLGHDLVLSARYILDNPFMTDLVDVHAEVIYRNGWQRTEWNDQIGVTAATHPQFGSTQLVVQCGQMGFLACGRESGSSFGSSFDTITNNLRTRIVIERKF